MGKADEVAKQRKLALIVCKAAVPYVHLFSTTKSHEGSANNTKIWKKVERDLKDKYPHLRKNNNLYVQARCIWTSYKTKALKSKGTGEVDEISEIILRALGREPSSTSKSEKIATKHSTDESHKRNSSGSTESLPRALRERTSTGQFQSSSSTASALPNVERRVGQDVSKTRDWPRGISAAREPSMTLSSIASKTLPLSTLLKVVDFCKRTNHAFRLKEDNLVFIDRDVPENRLKFPIDRLDHLV